MDVFKTTAKCMNGEKRQNIPSKDEALFQMLLAPALHRAHIHPFIFRFAANEKEDDLLYLYGNNPGEPTQFSSYTRKDLLPYVHPDDLPKSLHIYESLLKKEIEEFKTCIRIHSKDGMKWHELTGQIEKTDSQGNPLLLTGCCTEIDEQKKYEEELINAREKAEMADNMKSTYLANMSHEIRTPLNAIVGFSELLSFTEDEDEKQSYIDIIKANNEQLLHLIGDILDLSKIEAGLLSINYEQIELNELMDEIYQSIRLKIAPELNFSVEKGLDCLLFITDRSRLNQVITNLLNNAIKYTETGGISFGYRKQGNNLYFYVTDTGSGMPAEKLEKIFTRYVMLNQKKQGFGLGLAICKGIIEKFGGTISVASEEGKGTTFSFIIPIRTSLE